MAYFRKKWVKIALIFLAILVVEGYFFRYTIISGFDGMLGDAGDGRFNTLVCEHWHKVFLGQEPVRDLRVFSPQKNTLGYSDTLLAYALPFSLLRFVGLDMLRSMQLVLILFHLLGTLGLFWLLNRRFKLGVLASLFGAAMFSLSNNYFVKSGHTQLLLIGLVPWLFILIHVFYENLNNLRKKRIFPGILAILLFGVVTFSGFYTAYFTALFLLILFGVWFEYLLWTGQKPVWRIFNFIKKNIFEVIIYVASLMIVLWPTFWVYFPVIREQGARSFVEILTMLPKWNDFFNVSFGNLVWGSLLKILFPNLSPMSWELETGFPLVTLLLFFGAVFYFWRKRSQPKVFEFDSRFPLAIGISVLLVMLLILRIGNLSLWLVPYVLIPGTSALRAVSRYSLFLSLPVSIVLAFGAEALIFNCLDQKTRIIKIVLISALLVFLLLENTMTSTNCRWSIKQQRAQFTKVIAPPKTCQVFVILNDKDQLNAWVIADKFNLQTINGYSGHFPPYWYKLSNPKNTLVYNQGIKDWSQKNNLNNLCSYNPIINEWQLLEQK